MKSNLIELILHVCIGPTVITLKLLLDYYRLEKSQEILEMANPVTRMLLMRPAQLDLYAVSSSVCWDKRIQYLKYQEREISTKHRPLHGVILSYISSLDHNNCLQLPHLCMYKVTINLVYYQNGYNFLVFSSLLYRLIEVRGNG